MTRNHYDMRAAHAHADTGFTYALSFVVLVMVIVAIGAACLSYDRLTDTEQASIIWELETGR